MADKKEEFPAEVSDEELARMEGLGHLPKARVDSGWVHETRKDWRGNWDADARPRGTMENTRVASSPVGGETPQEALTSWEKQEEEAGQAASRHATKQHRSRESALAEEERAYQILGIPNYETANFEGLYRAHQQGTLTLGPEILEALEVLMKSYKGIDRATARGDAAELERYEGRRSQGDIEDIFTETETTGADDPETPTRSRTYSTLPPMTPRAERRQRAADLVMKKHGDGS